MFGSDPTVGLLFAVQNQLAAARADLVRTVDLYLAGDSCALAYLPAARAALRRAERRQAAAERVRSVRFAAGLSALTDPGKQVPLSAEAIKRREQTKRLVAYTEDVDAAIDGMLTATEARLNARDKFVTGDLGPGRSPDAVMDEQKQAEANLLAWSLVWRAAKRKVVDFHEELRLEAETDAAQTRTH